MEKIVGEVTTDGLPLAFVRLISRLKAEERKIGNQIAITINDLCALIQAMQQNGEL